MAKTTGAVDGAFEAFGAFDNGDDVWLLVSDDSGLGVSNDWGKSWSTIIPR